MKKKVLAVAIAAVVIASLAGCSTSGSSSAPSSASAPGPSALKNAKGVTEITIWHGLGAANGVAFQNAIDAFNTANQGKIHVTATFQGVYADLLAKYTAAIRSKSTPTIMLAGDVATGYMTDVKQSLAAASMAKANPGVLNLGDLAAAAKAYYTVGGVQEAVPMNVSTPVLWVNKDILAKAGLSNAPLNTLDEVVAAAAQIKAKTGIAGFSMPDDDWYVEQLTATAGQVFCTPDNGRSGKAPTAITINTGLAKQNISKVADLYRSGVAVDGALDGSAATSAFQAGKVGLILHSSGILGALKSGAPFNYQALPFPTSGPAGKSGPVIGGSALWLSSTATKAQQVAGWQLEGYLTSPEVQATFSQATGYVAINNKAADIASEQAYLKANANSQTFATQLKSTPAIPATAGCVSGAMTTLRTSNIAHLQAAFNNGDTVDNALDQGVELAKDAFATYKQQLGN